MRTIAIVIHRHHEGSNLELVVADLIRCRLMWGGSFGISKDEMMFQRSLIVSIEDDVALSMYDTCLGPEMCEVSHCTFISRNYGVTCYIYESLHRLCLVVLAQCMRDDGT